MKFNIKPMELVRNFTAISVAVGILGGIGYAAGWFVNKAQAQAMIEQSSYELQRKYDRKVLELDITSLTMQIGLMEGKPDRSAWENEQLRLWKIQLDEKTKLLINFDNEKAAQ